MGKSMGKHLRFPPPASNSNWFVFCPEGALPNTKTKVGKRNCHALHGSVMFCCSSKSSGITKDIAVSHYQAKVTWLASGLYGSLAPAPIQIGYIFYFTSPLPMAYQIDYLPEVYFGLMLIWYMFAFPSFSGFVCVSLITDTNHLRTHSLSGRCFNPALMFHPAFFTHRSEIDLHSVTNQQGSHREQQPKDMALLWFMEEILHTTDVKTRNESEINYVLISGQQKETNKLLKYQLVQKFFYQW